MRSTAILSGLAVAMLIVGASPSVHPQQPQIPTLQVCNPTKVTGVATVVILSREDGPHSGKFRI